MRHCVIRTLSEMRALQSDWQELIADSANPCLSMTPGWMLAWWETFGDGRELAVHCFWSEDRLAAVAPMMQERTRFRAIPVSSMTSTVNGHTPAWDLLYRKNLDREYIKAIVNTLVESGGVDVISLRRVPIDSPLRSILLSESYHRRRAGEYECFSTPIIPTSGDWDEFLSRLKRGFRRKILKKDREFNNQQNSLVECIRLRTPEDPIFAELVRVSKNSWKATQGADLSSSAPRRHFYKRLVENFGPSGNLQAWVARFDSKIIAFEFHVKFDRTTHPLRADFDQAYRRHSPGSVVEFRALRDCFIGDDVDVYDSCADQYWYLRHWSTQLRRNYSIDVFSDTLKSRLLYQLEYSVVPIMRRVKHSFIKRKS